MQAIWNGKVLAESNATVIVEGNHYFPPEAIHQEYFQPSDKHTNRGSDHYWRGMKHALL